MTPTVLKALKVAGQTDHFIYWSLRYTPTLIKLMRSRALLLLLLSLLLAAYQLRAQSSSYTPQSPNTASLGRFGIQPANLFTGIPSISIPIYDISAGSVNVPISLDYHAGGNRVTDMASWVGLGWALRAGGSITRAKVGTFDEDIDHGILTYPLNLTLNNVNTNGEPDCERKLAVYDDYLLGPSGKDRGYDIFSFMLPGGKSGKFILKPDTSTHPTSPVTLLVYERIRITYTTTPSLTFTIVDEDGITYVFDQRETVDSQNDNVGSMHFPSAWYPTEIRGIRPTERVSFSYTSAYFQGYPDFYDRLPVITNTSGTCDQGPPIQASSFTFLPSYSVSLLSEIIFPGGKLKFFPGTVARTDAAANAPVLDKIELHGLMNSSTPTYQLIKQFDLIQSYLPVSTTNGGFSGPLSLSTVRMQDASGAEVGKYGCEYNTAVPMPGFSSRSRDLWGYYNGKPNTTLVPTINVIQCANGRCSPENIPGGNRDADELYMKACILTKLTYPTCGYSQFFYETNTYQENGVPKLAGGLRIARIETRSADSNPGPIQVKTYKYGVNENGYGNLNVFLNLKYYSAVGTFTEGDLSQPPSYCERTETDFYSYFNGVLTPYDGSPVVYPMVTEYEGSSDGTTLTQNTNGRTVYTFTTSADVPHDFSNTNLSYIVSYYWKRGQLETKTVYSKTGSYPVYKLVNTWISPVDRLIENTGILVDRIGYYRKDQSNRVIIPTECGKLGGYTTPYYVVFPQGNTRLAKTVEYQYAPDGSSVPTSTTTTYNGNYQAQERYLIASDGTITGRHFTYPHDFTISANPSPTGNVKAIKILQDNNQRNTVLEEYGYKLATSGDTNPVMTDGKLTLYQEHATLTNQAFPQQVYELQVIGGSTKKNSFTPMLLSNTSTVTKDPLYTSSMTFTSYDGNANPTQFTLRNGLTTQLNWQTLTGTNNNLFSALQQQTTNYGSPNALTTQYGYDVPLLGLKSTTDPKGLLTTFTYDLFGRLKAIRDQNNNLLQSYDYNYGCSPYNPKQLALVVPDIIPIMYARPTTTYGTTAITVVMDLYEINAVPTNGLITVKITQDPILNLNLDPTATTVGGRSVQNSVWTLTGPSNGSYTLTTTQPLDAGNNYQLSVGLTGVLTPGSTTGDFTIIGLVLAGSGGETVVNNNGASGKIDYHQN